MDFLKPKFNEKVYPKSHEAARGIPLKKKKGILKILSHVSSAKTKFFSDLHVNDDSSDLVGESEHFL